MYQSITLKKKDCWKSLSVFSESNSLVNIIVAGDLNITLAPNEEKKRGPRGKDHLHDMVEELIQVYDLIDLKPKLRHFTWSNNKVGSTNIVPHLDRFLVHSSLMDGNFIISLKKFPKLTSYHHPISLLFEKEYDLGPIPFRFIPLWID